ncbi:hypothetical protein, partial [Novosphingobium sp.]|uniref:hypothetical protein n=1 Tax=Novosphingobium sp. TaxID=1874826 RepID=UPI0025D1D8DE
TALPPPASEEGQVMVPVNAALAAIGARDAVALGQTMRSDATTTTATATEGATATIAHKTRDEFLARFGPGAERFEERLADPAIEIDGNIAMVWGRYTFLIDGKVHHCGYDHFDLIRDSAGWKIQNLTWSSRTTGCTD